MWNPPEAVAALHSPWSSFPCRKQRIKTCTNGTYQLDRHTGIYNTRAIKTPVYTTNILRYTPFNTHI